MNIVKLHTKVPKFDPVNNIETWPDEWREEFVNLDSVDRFYISEVQSQGATYGTIVMNSGSRLFIREPLAWFISKWCQDAIPEFVYE